MKNKNQNQVKGYESFTFYVRDANVKRYLNLYTEISSLLSQNEVVSTELLKEYFSLFKHESILKIEENSEVIHTITSKAITFFYNKKGYDFNGSSRKKVKAIPGSPETGGYSYHYYSFQDIIRVVVNHYINYKELADEFLETKEFAIKMFYRDLEYIKNSYLNNEHKKSLTPYKLAVIAAYLTHCLGFKLTTKQKPSSQDLFQASRNALKGI